MRLEIESTTDGLRRESAEAYLEAEGFEDSTIEVALEELLNRGYIYVVNEEMRLANSDT
ncbi:hypothetical protein [Halorussus salinisoli]|uniref:hypothetical protein n=1 Tax=Halorussus salinisoli TaxID=2558242 RepID=UPI0014855AED|nr:hypothetical protein [Halorussus salinisoli]